MFATVRKACSMLTCDQAYQMQDCSLSTSKLSLGGDDELDDSDIGAGGGVEDGQREGALDVVNEPVANAHVLGRWTSTRARRRRTPGGGECRRRTLCDGLKPRGNTGYTGI